MTMRQLSKFWHRSDRSYGVSALVGLLTYVAYGSLNDAWTNPALAGIAVYMFLCIPWYSRFSNRLEARTHALTRLATAGRITRYLLQLGVNLVLLWVFLVFRVLDSSGLDGIGGFFAAAAWITVVSQGGQYLAIWLARRGLGDADRNVVLAISVSAIVSALAVSGVAWIQPIYVAASLSFGIAMFGVGVVLDARFALRNGASASSESLARAR